MDIVVQREALLKPLQALNGVIEKKQTHAILSNVLLTIRDNQDNQDGPLRLTGTDLEIEVVGFVRLESLTAVGETTVSARKLFDICRALPENAILQLALEGQYLVVRTGQSSFKLNTLPAHDFVPALGDDDYPAKFSIKQSQLKNLLTKTYFAMGQQDVRHYLNGTFLEINAQSMKCVAADGHRLALAAIHNEDTGNFEAKAILPRKSVLELVRLLSSDTDNDVLLHMSDTRFRLATPDFIFTTKLINISYPDYNRLVPKGMMVAVVDREAIKQALTRVSILSNEKFRGVRVQLEMAQLRITANNSDQEQAEEVVPIEYDGIPMEMGFNVAYLLDVVSTITAKSIRCLFSGPNEGVLIESAEGDHSLYVVMPMRF